MNFWKRIWTPFHTQTRAQGKDKMKLCDHAIGIGPFVTDKESIILLANL